MAYELIQQKQEYIYIYKYIYINTHQTGWTWKN